MDHKRQNYASLVRHFAGECDIYVYTLARLRRFTKKKFFFPLPVTVSSNRVHFSQHMSNW